MKYASLIFALALLLVSCKEEAPDNFVLLKNGQFHLGDSAFHMMAMNYIVTLQFDGERLWPSSYQDYNADKQFSHHEPAPSAAQIRAELELMKEQGFNTVRVVQLAENVVTTTDSSELYIEVFNTQSERRRLALDSAQMRDRFKQGIIDFLGIAEEADIKVVLLLRWRLHWEGSRELALEIVESCKNSSALMAYDIYNEPLYFDLFERNKKDLFPLVDKMVEDIKSVDEHHLITIGLEGIREVFEWDPNMLTVDFLSMHPYEYEPEQVRNELTWYGQYIEKPWVIGETSIPADNDSVPYLDQLNFARKTLEQNCACGAIGYSWWQYKDVKWVKYHPSFMGMMALDGNEETRSGESVNGSLKPVSKAFKEFDPSAPDRICAKLPNYYNYSQHDAWKVTGNIRDKNGNAIEGAVVLGWNLGWSDSYHTITKPDGSFVLRSDFPIHHWMASATKYSMARNDCDPRIARFDPDSTLSFSIGEIVIEAL